jgi:hypothetical protein
VSLGEDNRDPTGRLRRFFLAAIRYDRHGRNWDYPDAEEDFSLFANMIEDLADRLAEDFRLLADEASRRLSIFSVVSLGCWASRPGECRASETWREL